MLPAGPGEPQRGRLCRPHPASGGVGGGLPLHPGEVRHLHPHGQGHDVHCQRLRPTGAGDHRPAGPGQHVPAGPDGAVAGGHHPHRLPGGADGGGDRGRPRPHRLPAGPRPRGVGPRRGHLPAVSGPAEPQRPVPRLGGGGHHRPHRAALLPARPAGDSAKPGVLRRGPRRLGLLRRPGGGSLLSPGGLRRPPGACWPTRSGTTPAGAPPATRWTSGSSPWGGTPPWCPARRGGPFRSCSPRTGPGGAQPAGPAVRPAVLRPVRGEAASQGPKGRFLRLHLPGQAAPGRGGLFLPQPVRRGGRSGGAGRPLRPVSPPGPPAGGSWAREEQRAACRILLQRADWDGADLAFTLCRL